MRNEEREVTIIEGNSYYDQNPQIYGSNVVWEGYDGNDYEIFLYDGSSTTQLTNNSYDDQNPQIYESNVVWGGVKSSFTTAAVPPN